MSAANGSTKGLQRRLVLLGSLVIGLAVPILLALWWARPPTGVPTATPLDHGAVGDGVTDDSAALQSAFDSVAEGGTVELPAGQVFAHASVLRLSTKNMRLTGEGTLLATREATSAVWVRGDGIRVDGVTLSIAETTQRWVAYEQMKLRIGNTTGVTVADVVIRGSAAAGVYVGGAASFSLLRLRVSDTRADGIQVTEGARDGIVSEVTVTGSGDDGVSVVSYRDAPPCSGISITKARVVRQQWGRGFAVVGGTDITLTEIYAEYSSSAGLYVAAEPNYDTLPVSGIRVRSATLVASNQATAVGHGAVMLYNGQADTTNVDISISDIDIVDTRPTAPWNVGLRNGPGARHEGVFLERLTIRGGPANPFATNADSGQYRLANWLIDGQPWPVTECG